MKRDWPRRWSSCFGNFGTTGEQWRLTAEGAIDRADLDAGNSAAVFDFVLRRGFFDDRPRLMPDGNIRHRLPEPGRGALERLQRVSSDAGPLGVVIANWEAGGAAFAAAFVELLKALRRNNLAKCWEFRSRQY